MKAIVTGGASGIGAAMVTRLRAEEIEVEILDLTNGFDVTEPDHWDEVGPVEIACLNAGVLGGPADPAEISLERYREAMRVNVDGVVLGVRRLARVMPKGGRIVVTASLAGLTAMPDDPVYGATKHAVVGFVRSVAGRRALALAGGAARRGRVSRTASRRRRHSSSESGGRRPCGEPRRGRRRSAPHAHASPSGRAASRP